MARRDEEGRGAVSARLPARGWEAESGPPVRSRLLPAPTAWPGLALGCRGLECEVARPWFPPSFLRSRGSRAAPVAASPFALLAALCPFPPFPALRAALLSACLPQLLHGSFFTPASSRSPWLAGAGRVKAETAPRLGVPGF